MKWFKRHEKPQPSHVCRVCGKVHAGLPTDFGFSLPDEVWVLGREAREQHLNWSTDVSYHEGRWFLRGVLEVPFQFQKERFGWGVWAEVSEETMARFHKIFDADGSTCPREPGTLANEVKYYSDTKGLPVEVQFGPADKRPLLYLVPDCQHILAEDQRSGIAEERYHEILSVIAPDTLQ